MARQDKVLESNLTSPQMIVVQSLSRLLNCHSNHHPFSDHLDAVLYAIIMVFLFYFKEKVITQYGDQSQTVEWEALKLCFEYGATWCWHAEEFSSLFYLFFIFY